ncbi:hypothetical protein UJ50_002109 [Salmonella enterica subsp. enterica]|nr:hypothetical protein [Salmonella enterica subsp. enterica]
MNLFSRIFRGWILISRLIIPRQYPMVFGGGYREALRGAGWRLVCFDLGFAK